MKFLSTEDKEALSLLTESPEALKALYRLCDACIHLKDQDVLKFDLSLPADTNSQIQKLALTKARSEGARSVVSDIRRSLESLKAVSLTAVSSKTE